MLINLIKSIEGFLNPYPNEHAARLLDPKTEHIRVRRTNGSGNGQVQGVKIPTTIDVIWFVVKDGNQEIPRAQALRFSTKKWTEEQARKWLKDNEIKVIEFEPAQQQDEFEFKYIGNQDNETADLLLNGSVGDEIDGDEVAQEIKILNEKGIKVINERINSGGGSVINGLSIVAANLNSQAEIRTFNEGVAASMAGIILMSGNKVFMNDYATLMIHEPSICGQTIETTEDEKVKRGLIALRDSLSKIIQNRSGKSKKEVDEIMEKESWFNANQAKNEKFIDEILSTKKQKENSDFKHVKESSIRKVGSEWEIVLIESGLSNNSWYWADEVLKKAVPLSEGIEVFAHRFGGTVDHRPDPYEDGTPFALNKVGIINNVRFKSGCGKSEVVGRFHCTNSALRDQLSNTWQLIQEGKIDESQMLGFSVDISGTSYDSGGIKHVTDIRKINSVDVVSNPSAGGRFERMVASTNKFNITEAKMNELIAKLLEMVKSGALSLEGSKDKSDEEITAMLKENLGIKDETPMTPEVVAEIAKKSDLKEIKDVIDGIVKKAEEEAKAKAEADAKAKTEADNAKDRLDNIENKIKTQETTMMVNDVLMNDTVLSDASKERIKESFAGKVAKRDEIEAAVKTEKEYLERITQSGAVRGMGIQLGDTPIDKKRKAMDLLIDPDLKTLEGSAEEYKGVPSFYGIRDAFERFTGVRVQEAVDNPRRITEATSSDFSVALGDSMNKRAIRMYKMFKERAVWTKFVTEESFNNLNQQKLFRIGGFGELSTVAEAGAYTELSTPSEDNPTYTPLKKGNKFTLTEEMIINDNLRAMQQFPKEMARSAVYTLSRFVFDLITGRNGSAGLNQQIIYDSGVLYTSAHGNYGGSGATLGSTNIQNGVTAMSNFAQADSNQPIMVEPRWLLSASDNRVTMWDLTMNELVQANANGGSIQNAIASYKIEPVPVPKLYLGSDTSAWYLIASPQDIDAIVIGYYNNKREPEILLQDQPTVGSVFTNDQITYRVKFRYGGAINDWRGFYGAGF